MKVLVALVLLCVVRVVAAGQWRVGSEDNNEEEEEEERRLVVSMTLVKNARASGALCLDGTLPAYHLHRGFGAGINNWLLQFEVTFLSFPTTSIPILLPQKNANVP
ncbi:hypothetical protein PIB30_027329 [Stylosanthes scabra]|uniref:Pectin acetylesterase n=1 Tax=Stylosanthes scabra TaxID=79078 RepID=A0ABU6RAU4_9FABA|nr:hypothetical protein [Stylosanthes scabra]